MAIVKEKFNIKFQGWKQKFLSQAGEEILIKSVAMAIPSYPVSYFKFPKSLCNHIKSKVTQFWWGQKDNERRIH